ncbi:unnamed protein product [Ostreobium quekettii]|uniref:glutathione transferase n=1 Tax=Ostreobium quekettii TaxID=121088 RepID=A0A8S1IR46_9CHLO|nr:unnamed protein product [Ostreobium quekettii]
MATKPVLHYFRIRGRGEPIRLALRVAGVAFEEENVTDRAVLKSDLDCFPFGQCPRYVDGDFDAVQSNAILRHIGRKHNLYGSTEQEATHIDMILDAVEDFRRQYTVLIYEKQLDEEAKSEYWTKRFDPSTSGERNGGAHMLYFSKFLKRYGGKFVVGSAVSIADVALFDLLEINIRLFQNHLGAMVFAARTCLRKTRMYFWFWLIHAQ